MTLDRARGVIAVALAQLRHDRARTTLAVVGVTLAVLATTLLAGTGVGVVETGQEKFDAAGRDLWVTGEVVRLSPGSVGGVEAPITGAHGLADDLVERERVRTAGPLYFQTVYVSADGDDFRTVAGFGAPDGGISVSEGRVYANDSHYAGGSYDGPRTRELLVSPRLADLLDVSVGDTVYVGGTLATARDTEYRVVGVSRTGSQFLGTPTVTLPLSELQTLTDAEGTDPATLVAVKLEPDASPTAVRATIADAYPNYEVRTNREQLRATVRRQAVVLAAGVTLVALSVVAGLTLTANTLLSLVATQLAGFAALNAVGCSRRTLVGVAATESLVVGAAGTCLGLALTLPAAAGLDWLAVAVVGFENVVRTPPTVFALGLAVALVTTLVSAVVVGYRTGRASLARLEAG